MSDRILLTRWRWLGTLLASVMGCCVADEPTRASELTGHVPAMKMDRVRPGLGLTTSTPASAIAARDQYEAIAWHALVPKEFDAAQDFKNLGLGLLRDDDPRAIAAIERLKRSWGQTPVARRMDNRRIRIDGFVVPLDAEGSQLREFLLVPHFGSCIHTPPPPPNQVIHVTLGASVNDLGLMDSVRVSGLLRVATSETAMGMSGYLLEAEDIAPLTARRPDDHASVRLRQTLPLLAAFVVPVVLAAGALTCLVRRDIRRTPRQMKRAARLRRLQARQRRRDGLRARKLAISARWTRLCRQMFDRSWT